MWTAAPWHPSRMKRTAPRGQRIEYHSRSSARCERRRSPSSWSSTKLPYAAGVVSSLSPLNTESGEFRWRKTPTPPPTHWNLGCRHSIMLRAGCTGPCPHTPDQQEENLCCEHVVSWPLGTSACPHVRWKIQAAPPSPWGWNELIPMNSSEQSLVFLIIDECLAMPPQIFPLLFKNWNGN